MYALLALCLSSGVSSLQASEPDFSSDYDRIFQIQVVSPDAGGKTSTGSGFQVSADGLIVTNYHVVSEFVNAPDNYQIRYTTQDKQKGRLELLDFDIVSDLALLRHPQPENTFFSFSQASLSKGEMAYALGNPGDWGMVMVPGPNNGLVEHQYEQRILFSGSLNPGMSRGPSLNKEGEVIGVNVATAGSQLSFLVPADRAARLADSERHLDSGNYQLEIAEQIKTWQGPRIQQLLVRPWPVGNFANRSLFGEIRHDFQCWGDTNESLEEREVTSVSRHCRAGDELFIEQGLNLGQISYSFRQYTPVKLNRFQFARTQHQYLQAVNNSSFRYSTNFKCKSDFVQGTSPDSAPSYQRIVTCLRAYKHMPGLYDSLVLVQNQTQQQAFTARLALSALEPHQIQAFNRRFVEKTL